MKLVYTNENKIIVENARNFLREEGIEVVIRNEFSSGGMGELSPMETWPELWIEDADFSKGKLAIDKLLSDSEGEVWTCDKCNEENEPAFEICWSCQAEHP